MMKMLAKCSADAALLEVSGDYKRRWGIIIDDRDVGKSAAVYEANE